MNFKNLDRPYIVAEIGVNHEGNEKLAIDMINKAKLAGAKATSIRFQGDLSIATNRFYNILIFSLIYKFLYS